ncbi:MAG: LysR substrate-binding domain-containing protein [Pseudomonadota bacterium]
MDKLTAMRTFAAVARKGSYTAAARTLGISIKLASKQVQVLEADLRTRLLNRTTRSVTLTDTGRAYLQRCRPILEQIDELDALVRERQGALAGTIRITAPTSFGATELADALASFLTDHPEVEVELRLSDSRVAVVEEGFDLAVRIGTMRDTTLVAQQLSAMPLVLCAAPAYLDRHGWPQHPQALATHRCLVDDTLSDARVWRFRRGHEETAVEIRGPMRANAPRAIGRLAEGGLGIGRVPLYVAREALHEGRLQALLPGWTAPTYGLFALYPPNRQLTARVRALLDHLGEAFGQKSAA